MIEQKDSNRLMIGITAGEWEGIHHRPHHMMKRAARDGWTVLFIESPMTYLSPLKDSGKLKHWKNSKKGIQKVAENLYVITLPPFLPFGNKYRFINRLNQKKLLKTIDSFIHSKNFSAIDIYTFLPQTVDLLPLLNYDRLIYDCVDDHISFTGLINKQLLLTMEEELSGQANVTYFTAKELQRQKQAWSKRSYLVPNGAEYEHFSQVEEISKNKNNIPDDMTKYVKAGKTIIGFIGGIGDWVDLDIIYEAAQQLTNTVFIIIGPVDIALPEKMKDEEKMVFLGLRPYEQLPSYIAFFDGCLISFKINELTKSVNPIKLYEYLSSGKPVISTAIPEVVVYEDYVDIVHDAQQLAEKINELTGNDKSFQIKEKKARQAVGEANSWDSRWEKIKEKFNS